MVKNIPSPCCGSYDVLVRETDSDDKRVWYKASCPECGLTTIDSYDSRQEAIHEYENLCIATWKRNRNGLLDWMKKPANGEEIKKRIRIENDMSPYLLGRC